MPNCEKPKSFKCSPVRRLYVGGDGKSILNDCWGIGNAGGVTRHLNFLEREGEDNALPISMFSIKFLRGDFQVHNMFEKFIFYFVDFDPGGMLSILNIKSTRLGI